TCVCNDSDSYWDGTSCVSCGTNQQVNEAQNGCECKSNWHGEGCTTYCDTSVASMSSGMCACKDTTTYWNGQACESCGANKVYENGSCVCDDSSYNSGDSCIQCPAQSTVNSDKNGCACTETNAYWNGNSCITCDTNATFTNNECVCNKGYSGDGQTCAVCELPRQTTAGNTGCECPTGTIWTGKETNRCEPNDDGSGGVTNLCGAGLVWDSKAGECKPSSCSSTENCPYGYICDITDGQCIKDWECENPHALDVTQEECSECANRTWSETDKCVNCDSRKGLILSSGKCVCPAGKVMRKDETTGEYRCQCPENTPADADKETCECLSGYDNIDKNGDGINECVIVCPEGNGLTGVRNAQGNCLCDVDSGYIEVATKLADGGYLCSCDETNDYYTGPEGCIKCVQTTREWCNKRTPAGSSNTNCDTIDETKWWCGFRKSLGATGFLVYNPSTKDYCELYEVLSKTALGFECTKCDDYTLYKGSRTTNTGICLCAVGEHLEGDMCIAECVSGNYYEGTGQCISCAKSSVYSNDGICHSTDICRDTENGVYWWYTWISKTKGNCSQSFPNYTTDMSDPCSYVYGCVVNTTTLPYCEINTIITTECQCASGDTNGYCCSVSSYPTASGCVSCTDGTVPNANRTGCEKCPNNMIAKNGVCTRCDEGYYPNSTQVRCLACPAGTTTDAEGLACTVCVDAEKVFDNTTGTCLDPCTQTADCSESTDGMCCDSERKVCRKCIPDDCNTNKGFEYADGKCICSAQTPILQNAECVACSSVDETKPYWDGVECVATCPTEKPYVADNVCVESCPTDKPYVDNASCVSECSTEKPVPDANNVCQSCAEVDTTKPVWDATNGACSTCEVVYPETPVWDGTMCVALKEYCTAKMSGYDSANYVVSDDGIITYTGDMIIENDLDISDCDLRVNGTLTVSEGISATTKNVTVTASGTYGLNLLGSMTVNGNLTCTGVQYGCYAVGTDALSGILKVTGNVEGTTTTTEAVATRGFFAGSNMTTVNIGGSLTGISSASTGTTYGIYINSPSAVIDGAIKGISNGTASAYGVYIGGDAVVTAKSTVIGTINDTAKYPYSIYVKSGGNFTVSEDVVANHTMYVNGECVIKNGSLTVNASATGYNALSVSGTLETQTDSITANGTYTAIDVRGILKSATTITGTTSGSGYGVYMAGTTLSGTNITGTSTSEDGTGLFSSSGTISATGTVQGVGGFMGIGVSGKITANLIRAKSTGTSNPVAFLYYPTAYVKATTAIQYCSAKQKQGTASGETLSPSPTKNCNW
ncbi:MAG: hypothetical protein IJC11_05355, partial [Alphaproteobacteria bacterium]|nr:hypothetical protein [Alphaproteobacteria bacterium]